MENTTEASNNALQQAQQERLCSCGRDFDRNHCPKCGSSSNYAKSTLSFEIKSVDGIKTVMCYHCRGCGKDYNDLDRFDCKAPVKKSRVKQERPLSILDGLSPEDRLVKINEVLKKGGLVK